ncbi:MAG: hypothetical protein JXO48_01510 [Deltaproteobacteria bacterium]|nr:hypothetical protein [Deltaproteobacteria bacterium]
MITERHIRRRTTGRLFLIIIAVLIPLLSVGCEVGDKKGADPTDQYGAYGTYTYVQDTLTLYIEGTEYPSDSLFRASTRVFTVTDISAQSMTWLTEDGGEIVWPREFGEADEIVGGWGGSQGASYDGYIYNAYIHDDATFVVIGTRR